MIGIFLYRDMARVALLPDELDGSDIIMMPHPADGTESPFVISNGRVFELLDVDRPHSSFFLGNTVQSNGSCLIAVEIHPLFLVLPLVRDKKHDIVNGINKSALAPVSALVEPILSFICSMSKPGDVTTLCYDEALTVRWIVGRTEKLIDYFRVTHQNAKQEILVDLSFDVVRHYINKEMRLMMKEELKARYPGWSLGSARPKLPPQPQPQKKRGKGKTEAPAGNRSLTDFFKPKPAP